MRLPGICSKWANTAQDTPHFPNSPARLHFLGKSILRGMQRANNAIMR